MGTCFPESLLGAGGYLVNQQTSIQKLSIVTDTECRCERPLLGNFTALRELSLKVHLCGITFGPLKAFLKLHHRRLTLLELDFIDWSEVNSFQEFSDDDYSLCSYESSGDEEEPKEPWTPLAEFLLPDCADQYEQFLPNIQTLSLSQASFKGSWDSLIDGLNFLAVKELRLLNCKRAFEFLGYIAQTRNALNVTKLELVINFATKFPWLLQKTNFLGPFEGLKDLFLLFQSCYSDTYHAERILRHRNTLRRLVYHRRHYCETKGKPYTDQFCDQPLGPIKDFWIPQLLLDTKVESLGLCERPPTLKESCQSCSSRALSLRLLHLRFTGRLHYQPAAYDEDEYYFERRSVPKSMRSEIQHTLPASSPMSSDEDEEDLFPWEKLTEEKCREQQVTELETFADWAFSRDGFPCLQVLASGDFSYGDRFAEGQILLVRNPADSELGRPWRKILPSDIAENELVHANMDMISACPVSPLYYDHCFDSYMWPGVS